MTDLRAAADGRSLGTGGTRIAVLPRPPATQRGMKYGLTS